MAKKSSKASKAGNKAVKAKSAGRKVPAKTATLSIQPASIQSFSNLPENVPLKFVGLIAPTGSGGGSADGRGNTWTFAAQVAAWKVQGSVVVEQSLLLVWRKVSERKLSALMKATPSLRILEFHARRPAASERPKICAQVERLELIRVGGPIQDAGLEAVKQEFCRPIELRDRTFGVLRLNRESEQFEGESVFRGEPMNVYFRTQSMEELRELIEYAKPLWRQRPQWFKNFLQAAYQHYQGDMADEWWDGDEPLTEAKYRQLLGWPVSAEFFKDKGGFQFVLGAWCEDLYTDHGIEAVGSGLNDFAVEF